LLLFVLSAHGVFFKNSYNRGPSFCATVYLGYAGNNEPSSARQQRATKCL